jgi:copper chaperone CopZ
VRAESNLRRLEGVRSVRSSLAAGTVTVVWQPGVRLNMQKLKAAVVRWRGAVRYGGSTLTVTGVMEDASGTPGLSGAVLRAVETGQRFRIRTGEKGPALDELRAGTPQRVVGRVIRGGEGNEDEIWLEVERTEPVDETQKPR